jgi:FkbM family methyltransferase
VREMVVKMLSNFPRMKRVVLFLKRKSLLMLEKVRELSPAYSLRKKKVSIARKRNSSFVAYVRSNSSYMVVDPNMFFAEVYVCGVYERQVVRFLKRVLHERMVCLDIGANVGYFTLLMSRIVGPSGSVISFEPTPHTFEVLRKNIALNGCENVRVEQIALFDRQDTLEFHEGPPGYEVYNSLGNITHPSAAEQSFTTTKVQCLTLDSYLATSHTKHVDFIKMDVEGAERFVLNGMLRTLDEHPNLQFVIEFADTTTSGFGYSAKEIGHWLLDRGCQLFQIGSYGKLFALQKARLDRQRWQGQMIYAKKT